MAAEELVIKAIPEGFSSTNKQLETTDEKFEEISGSVEESTGLLSSLSNKFGGAISAIVAGVAVATAGLLSQVPVLGEVVSGLSSVVSAVAFQLDKRLRPILGPVRDGLFELANAIFEGDFGKAEQIIKNFVDAIASIDFGQVFADITDAVDGILEKIQDSFSGSQARGVIEQFLGLFTGFASFAATKLAGFIRDVISELQGTNTDNVLAEFLVDGLDALVQFSSQATQAISSFLSELDYVSLLNSVIQPLIATSETLRFGIQDLIKSIDWSKVATTLKDEFTPSLGEALQDLLIAGVKGLIFPTKLAADLLAEGFKASIDIAQNAIDPNKNQTVAGQTQSVESRSPFDQSPSGRVTNPRQNKPPQLSIDGRSLNKRTGRYAEGEVAGRGGTLGI